jgi:hypothetical protein
VVTALGLPQVSVALIEKVRVVTQPVTLSTWVTLTTGVLQVSVKVTNAVTLASLGGLAGLQPKSLPVGALLSTGPVVSVVQV